MRRSRSTSVRAHARRVASEGLENRILFAEVAENLLVDVDATNLPEGPATVIPNAGTLGGVFEAWAGGETVPVIGQPLATATSGTRGIRLDGDDFLQLLQSEGGDLLLAPAGLTGPDPTRSIEAWVWNPGIAGEETMVSWGRRGGPDGSNMSFNYGNDARWGAVGHWGGQDIGWGDTVPAAREWHHVVYTYDGTTTRIYVDGALANSEELGEGAINTHPDTPISIGTQTEPDGFTPTGALRGSLTLGKVRVHDGVLTDAQVAANYNAELAEFVEPVVPPPPPPPDPVLLVDIDATNLPEGPAPVIPNAGTMGGFFQATGGEGTVPVIDQPLPSATEGTRGIRLDGNDFLQHVEEVDGALLPAPEGVVGLDPTRTIEVWVWNPTIPAEETMVAWGKRGGPDGTNVSFNYGNHNAWGAVGHWGSQDIGWGETVPAAREWHHLVYSYDGTTTRIYVDGELVNTELLGEGAINTHEGMPINIGTQIEPDGVTPTTALRGSLTLGKVRVYEGVLTDAQVAANYELEQAGFIEPPPPTPAALTAPPIHRYSFNEPAGDATDGQVITDLIGDADGTVVGSGATWDGTRLVLPGGPSDTAPYGDLPNELLSTRSADFDGTGEVSIEGWVRHTGNQTWGRFFDFGASTAGELFEPGGTGNGTTYLMLSQFGNDPAVHRFELINFPGNPDNRTVDPVAPPIGTDVHFVATWNEATGDVALYEQGIEVATFNTPIRISSIVDINNWLGRSNYTQDANFQGEFDEFRIYDRVLTPQEVAGNFQAGADVVTGGGTTVAEVFVRGSSWLGQDDNPATTTFMEYLEAKGLGDDVMGYRLFGTGRTPPADNPEDVIPWINADQLVVRYATVPTGSGVPTPGTLTLEGQKSDYTITAVTPVTGDPTAFVLQLNKPLGGGDPAGGAAPPPTENGDRVTLGIPGGGAAGSTFSLRMNVLQGDTDHSNEVSHSVVAADFSEVKRRFFKNTTSPTGTAADYSAFHDVDASGSIIASDFSEVKKRFFHSLPAPTIASITPAAAPGGALPLDSSATRDLFSATAILA